MSREFPSDPISAKWYYKHKVEHDTVPGGISPAISSGGEEVKKATEERSNGERWGNDWWAATDYRVVWCCVIWHPGTMPTTMYKNAAEIVVAVAVPTKII